MTAGIEIRRQIFATIAANLSMLPFSWNCAWTNANYLDLPITEDEAALVVSLVCVGGFIGNLIYLFLIDIIGRKNSILLMALPSIVGWLLVFYAQNVYWYYLSRFLFGVVGGGGMIALPVFTAEICSDHVRGVMNALAFLFNSIASVIAFCIAFYMDYRWQSIVALFIPCLFFFAFIFVPETPAYLQKKSQFVEAENSFEFYKGVKKLPEMEKFMSKNGLKETDTRLAWNDFFGSRASRRAMIIVIGLVIIPQFSGCFILLTYTTKFFKDAGSSFTPLESSILINIVQLAANIVTMFLIERLGRKILFVISSIGASMGMFILAIHNLYQHNLPGTEWVPIYVLSFTIFIASIGLLSVPYIITIDVLSAKIRSVTMTFTCMSMWVLGFVTNFAYINLLNTIELHGCLMFFSAICLLSALFALTFIPETKGKSYESIVKLLEK